MSRLLSVRGALAPRPVHGNVWATAVRVGLSVALVLGALYAAGHVELIPYAAMGCFTCLYARDETYARRRVLLLVVGAALTLSVALGALTQVLVGHTLAAVVVASLVAGGGKYLSDALALGAPAGLMFVFAVGVAAYNPLDAAQVPLVVATTAGAGAVCWLLAQAGALAWAAAPERLATARALTARAEDVLTGGHSELARARACAELSELARRVRRERRPQAVLSRGELRTFSGWVQQMRSHHRQVPSVWGALGGAWRRPSPTPVSVVRIVLACLVAGAGAWMLGMGHGYWAAVSAGSVLQAANVTTTWHRTLQRAGGTVVGMVLAGALFQADYSVLGVIALVVVLQMGAELVVALNYSYGLVFVTPLTLALSNLAQAGGGAQELAGERLWATVLGALVGLAVCALVPNRSLAQYLEQARAECEAALELVAGGGGAHERRRLGRSVVALSRALDLAAGEPGSEGDRIAGARRVLERARFPAGARVHAGV
ncbi:hypothetical protein GCM10007147_29790 [Nocardiopsis kunsanensis]|uniref:Integral membrane bound transporter domain-containing protein n=1 Tax=Nocardiopsis kunsanensis TaxID=141693 RepID=A0A919CJS2_9ACTN|nr:FUSC family protein [Nocardiopsis kunsanensis]GHD29199.1 hypothetical protein GCM10007147_29790 [Nocardiopsis kunsanensis]